MAWSSDGRGNKDWVGRDGILAAVRLGLTNARGVAPIRARVIIRRALGFHSAKAAAAQLMLLCGPIELLLPHEERHQS